MGGARCRFCGAALGHTMVDLGPSPLCESYLAADELERGESFYPLRVLVCQECLLVQLSEYVSPERIFSEYAYFSSYSTSWLAHARSFVARSIGTLGLGRDSRVLELASNDGYLLQYFVEAGVPCLGVEPAANVAEAARQRGVPTRVRFFDEPLARELRDEGWLASLVVANNVLAQVPDLNSFVAGVRLVLEPHGTLSAEFPHVLRLIEGNQLDTIYHEHFSYFSLLAIERVFAAHGLAVFDVEQLPTHGGSLRVWARHAQDASRAERPSVAALRQQEQDAGLARVETYCRFEERARETKRRLLELLIPLRREGRRIAGYGAPGKGNTLLNYCGIRRDFLDFTVDRNPYKQGRFLPGSHVPIHHPSRIDELRPDYVLILPWNLKEEILAQLAHVRSWGARFIVPIPEPAIVD